MRKVGIGCLYISMLILLLAGCDAISGLLPSDWLPRPADSAVTVPPARSTATPTVSPTPDLTPTPAPRILTLDFWVPDFLDPSGVVTGTEVFYDQILDFSSDVPDVQVRLTVKADRGDGGLYHLLSTASEAAPSLPPDLIVLHEQDLLAAAEEGVIQPIDGDAVVPDDYFPAPFASMRNLDGIWGLPYLMRADQMAYRARVGTTVPLSWTGVLSADADILLPAGPSEGIASDILLTFYVGTGGRLMDQNGLATLERANLERVYGFFQDLIDAGLLNADRALDLEDAESCWALYQEGVGTLSPVPVGLFWPEPPPDSWPAWVPTEDGEPVVLVESWGIAIVTEDPLRYQAALDLALWLTASSRSADLAQAIALVPSRRQALNAWTLLPEEVTFLDQLLSNGVGTLPPNVDMAVRRALQAGLVVLLQGEVDSPEAAASHALTNLRR
jgi:ABC-type glycerol-3-phosphate transport system substrate-binding protein